MIYYCITTDELRVDLYKRGKLENFVIIKNVEKF